jgi:integrase
MCRSTYVEDRKTAQEIAKRAAREVRRTITELAALVNPAELPSATVEEYAKRWLLRKEAEVAESSMKFYRSSIGQFLAYLGERAKEDISTIIEADIVGFRNDLATKVSATTCTHVLSSTRALFRDAVEGDYVSDDPCTRVKDIRKERGGVAKRAFTMDELRTILQLADAEWASMILFSLYTGQRLSDIANLTWHAIDTVHGEIRFVASKTGRQLVIPMAPALAEHLASLPVPDEPEAFVHPVAASKPQASLSNEFATLLVAAGLRQHPKLAEKAGGKRRSKNELSFHALRHTATSLLHDAGVPQSVILAYVGHSSTKMNRRYTHIGSEALTKAAASLPRIGSA